MIKLSTTELATLRAAGNCTDEAGLPIMSEEASAVIVLDKLGLARIAGENQNRLFILPAGRGVLQQHA